MDGSKGKLLMDIPKLTECELRLQQSPLTHILNQWKEQNEFRFNCERSTKTENSSESGNPAGAG